MGHHRREVWGDDPEERDADAAAAELAQVDPAAAHRWHDHPAVVPFKAISLFIRLNGRRVAITIAGAAVLLVGLAGLALPILPGWALIFAGLGILATEYVWARRLLLKAKEITLAAKDKAKRKKPSKGPAQDAGD